MFDVDDIRDWRGLPVVDKDGGKIGKLEAVYFDTATEEPTFATVKVGCRVAADSSSSRWPAPGCPRRASG